MSGKPTSSNGGSEQNTQVDANNAHKEGSAKGAHDEENKVELSDAQIKAAGVTIQTAGPAKINSTLQLPGEIRFNEDHTAHVVPRMGGTVETVSANLGQQVKKGQVLATIASAALSEQRSELLSGQKRLALAQLTYNREKKLWQDKISAEQDYLQAQQALRETEITVQNARQKLIALGTNEGAPAALSRYELRAPFDGMLVEKHIALGEAVKEDANVFTISDLSTVWAEINVSAKDLSVVRVGEKATVKALPLTHKPLAPFLMSALYLASKRALPRHASHSPIPN